ncbi:MAG: ATP-binding protein [Odoribacter sp.]
MKKRAFIVLTLAFVLLGATALTEYLFYRQDENTWVERFEERLHEKEVQADHLLETFRDSVNINAEVWEEDLIFVGFKEGKIFFWTNELVEGTGLFKQLTEGGNFIRWGNTHYEVRSRKYKDVNYFALLKIKNDYPYTNNYIKNKFGEFLKITEENEKQITISPVAISGGHLIQDKDNVGLFYIGYGDQYKERASNYLLLSMYLLFFLSLFYIYDLLLKNTKSWKSQLLYFSGFLLFLLGLRYFMQTFRMPPTLYRMPIFDEHISKDIFLSSIGDLLMTTFCIFQIVYITFTNLKINYQSEKLHRFRYLIAVSLIGIVFLFIDFFNFLIDFVVENMDIHLNVAQLIHVGIPSVLAFIAIIFGGLVIFIIIYVAISLFQHIMSFWNVVKMMTLICLGLWLISSVFNLYTNFWDCFFIWVISLLLSINKYLLKKDIQRSIYILVIFLLSIYIVMVTKKYECYKEQRQRMDYATELIEERDYNFEKRLLEMDSMIRQSTNLEQLLNTNREQEADSLLKRHLLDMGGYNYSPDITFCRAGDSLLLSETKEYRECREYFEYVIQRYGHKIGSSGFYSIGSFDGYVTYLGRFRYGNINLYLRFDAAKDDEGLGYPQILSRKSANEKNNIYRYSYAKYSKGELVSSSGNFVYYKKLKAFGKYNQEVELIDKDKYSHMMIPVDDDSMLVISLYENAFTLYYMNVLYAFFLCIIIFSYGLFFNVNRDINFRRGTLKTRIKNNVISLIFILFVILTTLSIYMNTKSFEGRHNTKVIELLKYVNKELEHLDCVDVSECPEITKILSDISELLMIDINIYSTSGGLVATSRPEVFEFGFDGSLINPKAQKYIQGEGSTSYIESEKIGELGYMSAYMPLTLDNGKSYILNVPYFAQNDELNLDIIIMVVITINIAIVVMVLAFILSGVMAEQVTKPLQMVNDKLKKMHFGGKNEQISYHHKDEVGMLVQEYNNMVAKLDESVEQLARSERENAWREMARQIAHEIKNPLTPMKLNIQFMLRSLQMEDSEKFKQRFKDISGMLIEQIDNMAAIASAFSDFAKMSVAQNETFEIGDLVNSCVILFRNNVELLKCDIEPEIRIFADKEQMRRVIINLLKNAEQSIPDERKGEIQVVVRKVNQKVEIRIRDNGCGISEDSQKKIFEPNFTTKSSGTGLGLAISRRIVESFGGKIGFHTELEKGTEFYVILNCMKE